MTRDPALADNDKAPAAHKAAAGFTLSLGLDPGQRAALLQLLQDYENELGI